MKFTFQKNEESKNNNINKNDNNEKNILDELNNNNDNLNNLNSTNEINNNKSNTNFNLLSSEDFHNLSNNNNNDIIADVQANGYINNILEEFQIKINDENNKIKYDFFNTDSSILSINSKKMNIDNINKVENKNEDSQKFVKNYIYLNSNQNEMIEQNMNMMDEFGNYLKKFIRPLKNQDNHIEFEMEEINNDNNEQNENDEE